MNAESEAKKTKAGEITRREFLYKLSSLVATFLIISGCTPDQQKALPESDLEVPLPAQAGTVVEGSSAEPTKIAYEGRLPTALNPQAPKILVDPNTIFKPESAAGLRLPAMTTRYFAPFLVGYPFGDITLDVVEMSWVKGTVGNNTVGNNKVYVPEALVNAKGLPGNREIVSYRPNFNALGGELTAPIKGKNLYNARAISSDGSSIGFKTITPGEQVVVLAEVNGHFYVVRYGQDLLLLPQSRLPQELLGSNHTLLRMNLDIAAGVMTGKEAADVLRLRETIWSQRPASRIELVGTRTGDYMVFHHNGRDYLAIRRSNGGWKHIIDLSAFDLSWTGAVYQDAIAFLRGVFQRVALSETAFAGKLPSAVVVNNRNEVKVDLPLDQLANMRLRDLTSLFERIGVKRLPVSLTKSLRFSFTPPTLSAMFLNYLTLRETMFIATNCINCNILEKITFLFAGRLRVEDYDFSKLGDYEMEPMLLKNFPNNTFWQLSFELLYFLPVLMARTDETLSVVPLTTMGYTIEIKGKEETKGVVMPEDQVVFRLNEEETIVLRFPTIKNPTATTNLTISIKNGKIHLFSTNKLLA